MMNHIISEIKNGGKDRRCGSKNGHELHVTRESKRHKLEAYEQDSHHDDPGCKTSKNVASSLKETKAIDSCSMRRPLDSPENISLEHKTCNQPHIEPYAKYKFIYKFPWMPAAPCPNQDGSVIGVPEVTNTSSTTEEQREDGSVNEVPELTNTSNTTGEEPREKYPMILSAELVPSSTTEMEPGEAIKGFKDTGVIHDADIHSDGRHTAHNSQKQNRTEMSDNRVTEDKYKDQEMGCIQQATSETQAHREEFLSEQKPATINVYSNMVRNETCRMMTSIDMIVTEATHLFGTENTQVFFDLLAENIPHFELAGAISEFKPNMAESVTRQHGISFFEHANYVMTRLMTSLSRSEQKQSTIDVYINSVRNETCRMVKSINMILTKATHLFGPEKTQIFFDLVAENMPHFESPGAISEFEPNMADSVIRQHVKSFFEHANYVMTQIMTSLSSVPDSDRLRQMPEPDFRALIKRVIESSIESKSDLIKGLCLEGDRLTRDELHHFIATQRGNTREDVLNRLRLGHEMFAYRFDDKNEEISQPTE